MRYTDLKTGNLEAKLAEAGLEVGEVEDIKKDASYYDRYILVTENTSKGFIKIWRQHVGDQYIKLYLEECEIVNMSRQQIYLTTYIDVLDRIFELPQIIRVATSEMSQALARGFSEMADSDNVASKSLYKASALIPIRKNISATVTFPLSDTRHMTAEDLAEVERIFEEEYPLRYRAVKPMFERDPNFCFVCGTDNIKGIILAEKLVDCIYVHQMLVRQTYRAREVDSALINTLETYAKMDGIKLLKGTARGNLLRYYMRKLKVEIDLTEQVSQYLVRYDVMNNFK